jgi:hypothetical protein
MILFKLLFEISQDNLVIVFLPPYSSKKAHPNPMK